MNPNLYFLIVFDELIFAPIDASLYDDPPILPSGFRIILHDSGKDAASPDHVTYLASALGVGTTRNEAAKWSVLYKRLDYEQSGNYYFLHLLLTIFIQMCYDYFPF